MLKTCYLFKRLRLALAQCTTIFSPVHPVTETETISGRSWFKEELKMKGKVQTNIPSYKFALFKIFVPLGLKLYGLFLTVCVKKYLTLFLKII
jgi:hypothetical protein